jgi:hypothetical protein
MKRVGRVTLKDKQIQIARIGIESVIAHCIAQNLKIDPGFPVHWYIEQCEAVLSRTNIPDYLIIDILDEAEDKGMNEEPPASGGASQLHPENNSQLIEAIENLNKLFLEVM